VYNVYIFIFYKVSIALFRPYLIMIKIFADKLSLEEIIDLIIENAERDMESYDYNYWKSILKIALMDNDDFIEWQ
jgi:hypothetical protein